MRVAIVKMKCHRASRIHDLLVELYKGGSNTLLEKLTDPFKTFLERGVCHIYDLFDVVIVSGYKNKGGTSDCLKYRSSVSEKMARTILDATVAVENLTKSSVVIEQVQEQLI